MKPEAIRKRGLAPGFCGYALVLAKDVGCLSPFPDSLSVYNGGHEFGLSVRVGAFAVHSVTFMGEVQGGRLQIEHPLGEFEGKQVVVTLVAADAPPRNETAGNRASLAPRAALEAELLEDTGRIRTPPRAATIVAARVVSAGRRPPRIQDEQE